MGRNTSSVVIDLNRGQYDAFFFEKPQYVRMMELSSSLTDKEGGELCYFVLVFSICQINMPFLPSLTHFIFFLWFYSYLWFWTRIFY